MAADVPLPPQAALLRARRKVYARLLPLLFACYVFAYVDRTNVAIAKLTMARDLPAFDNAVFGFGAGIFFWGYFLLEVPGAVLVEKWSARIWICRIMVTWGIVAAATAWVRTPGQFYFVRFLLGLAEAGFFPGVVVYFTHWFPQRDRTRALALFFSATPFAQAISPKITGALLKIGTVETVNGAVLAHPALFGMQGWQWVYIFWGLPAVVLGLVVLLTLADRPRDAKWLTPEERRALEDQLASEAAASPVRMTLWQGLRNPKVLLLAVAYFFGVTGVYGVTFFLPSILEQWYHLDIDAITWLLILSPAVALLAQLYIGWSSDRRQERRLHTVVPLALSAVALALAPATRGQLALTMLCFIIGDAGVKAFTPAFWTLPNLFLTGTAAAGSIGFINSVGNLGGFFGPSVIGWVQARTGSFVGGIFLIAVCVGLAATNIFSLRLGKKSEPMRRSAPD